MIKKERIINLTDSGRNNTTPVIRELRSLSDPPTQADTINFINEDRDIGITVGYSPPDPDGQFEEQLEAEGVTILNSTTYFPASKQTVTWKSKTPAEIAEEKGYFTKVVSN